MNIETLRIFCDVVQHQSFSRGAKINEVSQSAATQSVHRVEEYFGVQLVDRSKRPFVLTPEGQACYEGFREVLELYNSVESRVRSLRNEISGLVRVAAIYSVGLHDMSRCMQDFMRRYPKAKVHLEYLRVNKVYDAVLGAEVDLGIVSYPAASPDLDVLPLRSERMVVVCPPGHPLTARETVAAEDLEGMEFVGFDRDLSIRKEIDRCLRQRSINIRVVMEFDNIETVKQAVEIGAGVSILPEPTVRNEIRGGSLVAIPLVEPELYRPLGHHPPPAEDVHAQRRQVRGTAAASPEPAAGGPLMRDPEVLVRFRPSGREAYVLPGTRLVEAAAEAGIVLEVPCGGEGLCGKCRVIVASGAGEPTAAERDWFSAEELQAGWRLACQSAVCGPMEVEIPPASQAAAEHKILVHAEGRKRDRFALPERPARRAPTRSVGRRTKRTCPAFSPVRKQYVELPPPDPRRRPSRPSAVGAGTDVTGGADISVVLPRTLFEADRNAAPPR